MAAPLPINLATDDFIDEIWVDAVVACLTELQPAALPSAWTNVTFAGAWINFGPPYQNCQYRKVGDDVEVRGMCKSGAVGPLFTLPVGFRPPADLQFTTASGSLFAMLVITSAGVVSLSTGALTSLNVNFSFSTVA
jgi:hypothetical protein